MFEIFSRNPFNVFEYEQWRGSNHKLIRVHEQLCEVQTIAPPKARHCLYSAMGRVLSFIFYLLNKSILSVISLATSNRIPLIASNDALDEKSISTIVLY
jgi:hypothetical protein